MPLTAEDISNKLSDLKGWFLEGKEIKKIYTFENFVEAISFVNRVSRIAEAENHHPDILIQYNKVTISISTHSEGGLTEKDFILAGKIDGG